MKEHSIVYLLRNKTTGNFITAYRLSGPERRAFFVSRKNAEGVAAELNRELNTGIEIIELH